jgi:hypothetical protein
VPELFKSKYLKAFCNTYSSDYIPVDFYASLFLSSLSKLKKSKLVNLIPKNLPLLKTIHFKIKVFLKVKL